MDLSTWPFYWFECSYWVDTVASQVVYCFCEDLMWLIRSRGWLATKEGFFGIKSSLKHQNSLVFPYKFNVQAKHMASPLHAFINNFFLFPNKTPLSRKEFNFLSLCLYEDPSNVSLHFRWIMNIHGKTFILLLLFCVSLFF